MSTAPAGRRERVINLTAWTVFFLLLLPIAESWLHPPTIWCGRTVNYTVAPPVILSEKFERHGWGIFDAWIPIIPSVYHHWWRGIRIGEGSLSAHRDGSRSTDYPVIAARTALLSFLAFLTYLLARKLNQRLNRQARGFEVRAVLKSPVA